MIRTIRARVLLAVSVVLVGFLGLAGLALDRAFRSSAESSVREYLESQVYGLLAAAEIAPGGRLELPPSLPEPRLSRTNTGLFAWVRDASGGVVWKSPSALGTEMDGRAQPAPGSFAFRRAATASGQAVLAASYSVIWETAAGDELPFVVTVAEDFSAYQARVSTFRRTLWLWLVGLVVVLVIAQLAMLVWLLRPLGNIAAEVGGVERGERDRLSTDYPEELRVLALNLNALLANERNQRQRYRDKLDELAHSLKTPLTVLRNIVDRQDDRNSDMLREVAGQVERMQTIVSYQLHSAAGNRGEFALARPVKPEIEKLARSLNKAYHDRDIEITIDVDARHRFRGDVGDFVEIMGNLMDNACKYSRGRVRVAAEQGGADELALAVEDDGPGIPGDRRDAILGRRVRGDTRMEGQGIGLAVVADIVSGYGGSVEIAGSDSLGGARVVVRLPGSMRP